MFNPKYRLLIRDFPSEDCICLGYQFVEIIDFLQEILPKHTWYGADAETPGKEAWELSKGLNIDKIQLNRIGDDREFIQYCSKVTQFISGTFLCMDSNDELLKTSHIELATFDKSFRPIPCEGVLLEIRTFDTTYFEIFSENEEILEKLSKRFVFSDHEYPQNYPNPHEHLYKDNKTGGPRIKGKARPLEGWKY